MFSNDPIPRPGRPPASSSPLADYLAEARHGVDAGYAVLPRSLAESMPLPWQQQMVHLLSEFHQAYGHLPWPVYRVVPSRYEFLVDLDEEQLAEVGCLVEIDGDGELVYRERNGARIANPEDRRVLVSCLDPIPKQQAGFVPPAVAPRPVPPLPANEPAVPPAPPPAPPPTPPRGEPAIFEFPPPPAPSPFATGAGLSAAAQPPAAPPAAPPPMAPPLGAPPPTPPAGNPAAGNPIGSHPTGGFGTPPPGFPGPATPPPGQPAHGQPGPGPAAPGMPGMGVPGPQPPGPVPGQRRFGPPPEDPEETGYDQPFGPTGSGDRPNRSW